jgi:hypothetical protein
MPSMRLALGLTRSICRLLIGTLLFAQLAIAAHACPGMSDAAPATADAAMQPCHDMDEAQPNLCVAHCQSLQQAATDQAQPVTALAPVALALLYPLPAPAPAEVASADGGPPPTFDARGAAPPPHSILHCCLRI